MDQQDTDLPLADPRPPAPAQPPIEPSSDAARTAASVGSSGAPVGATAAPRPPAQGSQPEEPQTADRSGVDRGALILQGLRGAAAWSWRFLLVIAALTVILFIVGKVWVGVLPILLALIVASVLWPPVRWMRRHGMHAGLAAGLTLLGAIGLFVGIIAAISPSVAGQSRELAARTTEGLDAVVDWLAGPPLNIQSAQLNRYVEQATSWLQDQASALASGAWSTISTLGSIAATLALALVLTFFFLKDGPNFLPWVRRTAGRTAGMYLTEVLARVWAVLGGFLRGQAIVAAIDAAFIGLGLVVLRVPLALPLAIITFFLSFIPIVGAVVAGALAVLIALVSHGVSTAIWTLVLVIFVQQAESTFISPTVQSRAVSLHPVLVLLGVAAGGTIWGILGAFLAVPVIACVLTAMRYGSEHLDLRTGEVRAADVRNLTREGAQAAALAELSAPVFQLRAQQAYLQAEDERGAAQDAMRGRTTDLAATFRDRFLNPILRRDDKDASLPDGPPPDER